MEEIPFDELERKIGLTLDRDLLRKAFTHGSIKGTAQTKGLEDYRRLEFVGDAAIRLVTSAAVYKTRGDNVEALHDTREKLVPNKILSKVSEDLGLVRYLRWSGNREIPNSRKVLAKLYESLTGVIFLQNGYDDTVKFVNQTLVSRILELQEV